MSAALWILLAILVAELLFDAAQTRYIARHAAEGYSERNRFLGRHPSVLLVNRWFLLSIGVLAAAVWRLWRGDFDGAALILLIIGITVETACIVRNWRNGIRI